MEIEEVEGGWRSSSKPKQRCLAYIEACRGKLRVLIPWAITLFEGLPLSPAVIS